MYVSVPLDGPRERPACRDNPVQLFGLAWSNSAGGWLISPTASCPRSRGKGSLTVSDRNCQEDGGECQTIWE